MLDFQEILAAYPPPLQTMPKFLLREYLQYKILQHLYKHPDYAERLIFLGGTCLRLVHQNARFSEDLDFDNRGLSREDYEVITRHVQAELEREGYAVEINNVYHAAYRCHVRFPALLYQAGLSGHLEEKILIQLDCQPQGIEYEAEPFLLQKFDVFTQIYITPLDLLLSQKIYALLNRKRSKGRDFYDTVFLFGKTRPNFDYLEKKMGIASPSMLKERLLELCRTTDLNAMAVDVKPFLFNSSDIKRVELFEMFIRQTL